jgi:hypothetical protein
MVRLPCLATRPSDSLCDSRAYPHLIHDVKHHAGQHSRARPCRVPGRCVPGRCRARVPGRVVCRAIA